jgi:hypothetical protein
VEYPLVLAAHDGDARQPDQGGRLLGLNRNTLRKKIRELGVNVYRRRARLSGVSDGHFTIVSGNCRGRMSCGRALLQNRHNALHRINAIPWRLDDA